MNEAEKAYQAAQKEIARVAAEGDGRLSLGGVSFRALERLPPDVATLTDLQVLNLNHTKVIDLAPLVALPGLRELELHNTPVRDVSPLATLTDLKHLVCNVTRIDDISPLVSLRHLTSLSLNNTRISDLRPLASLNDLQHLLLNRTRVSDLAPLESLTSLRMIWLDGTRIVDLAPLSKLVNLHTLRIRKTKISELSPLSDLRELKTLYLSHTKASDLRPLVELRKLGTIAKGVPGPTGLWFSSTPATERDARLAELSQIENAGERARETLAYLQTLPPWPEPYTPKATPDGSPPQPIGTMPVPPEQDPALPLVWSEQGFTFAARSVASDPVTEAALAELRDLLEELRRKGNRHDDLYRLAGTLLERSAGAVADLNMVALHLSYQRLRRLHANREAREEPFDAETVTTLEAVLNTVPAVTLADEGVRTLIERQEADRAERLSAAEAEAAMRMLEAVEKSEAVFAPVVQETAGEARKPGYDDRLSGTVRSLPRNAVIAPLAFIASSAAAGAIGGPVGNYVYDKSPEIRAYAATMGDEAYGWAQNVLTTFRAKYESTGAPPASAPRPVPTMIETGVASPIAQGQAMMRTATAATSAGPSAGAGAKASQSAKVSAASAMTAGTNHIVTRSTIACIGSLPPCAASTIAAMRASVVSAPMAETRKAKAPAPFTAPPVTLAPSPFSTGTGSPVSIDSSMKLPPSTISPSAGMRSPGRTSTMSPRRRAESGISRAFAPRRTRAVSGRRAKSRRIASEARPFARASIQRPARMRVTISAAGSK